jgi:hypothetical protein
LLVKYTHTPHLLGCYCRLEDGPLPKLQLIAAIVLLLCRVLISAPVCVPGQEDDSEPACELDQLLFDNLEVTSDVTLDISLGQKVSAWQFVKMLRRRETPVAASRFDSIAVLPALSPAEETRRDGPKAALLILIGSGLLLLGGLGHRLRRRSQEARFRRPSPLVR